MFGSISGKPKNLMQGLVWMVVAMSGTLLTGNAGPILQLAIAAAVVVYCFATVIVVLRRPHLIYNPSDYSESSQRMLFGDRRP
jgi:hypothetical protein